MLGAKCGFAPSVDFVAQSLDLSFAKIIQRLFAQSAHEQRAKGAMPATRASETADLAA